MNVGYKHTPYNYKFCNNCMLLDCTALSKGPLFLQKHCPAKFSGYGPVIQGFQGAKNGCYIIMGVRCYVRVLRCYIRCYIGAIYTAIKYLVYGDRIHGF